MNPVSAYLAPYALALKAAGVAVLLGLGFAGGLRWQAGEVAKAEAKVTKVEGERDQWQQRAAGLQDVIGLQKAASQKAIDAAAQAKHKAEAAENRANAAAEDFIEASRKAREAIERAKGDPVCKAALERATCAALH